VAPAVWQRETPLSQQPLWLRWTVYELGLFIVLLFGIFAATEFIYFQF
jgi:hypothetical protein